MINISGDFVTSEGKKSRSLLGVKILLYFGIYLTIFPCDRSVFGKVIDQFFGKVIDQFLESDQFFRVIDQFLEK